MLFQQDSKNFTEYAKDVKGKTPYTKLKNIAGTQETSSANHLKNAKWISDFLREITPKLSTLDVRYTQMRKIYKSILPGQADRIDSIFKFSNEERAKRRETSAKRRTAALSDRRIIKRQTVKTLVKRLKAADTWQSDALLLMLATGRRSIEIMKVTPIPTQAQEGFINIANTAKDFHKPFTVPLLFITYKGMVKRWERVRDELKDVLHLPNATIASRYNDLLNAALQKLLKSSKGVSSHLLRKIYGLESRHKFKPSSEDATIYLNKVLGHKSGAEGTALHYMNIAYRDEGANIHLRDADDKSENANNRRVIEMADAIKNIRKRGDNTTYANLKEFGFSNTAIAKYRATARNVADKKEDVQAQAPINATLARMVQVIKELKQEGTNITNRAIKARGFGSKSISAYLKQAKQIAGV